MAKKKRRSFTKEFKAEAVRLCRVGDRSIGRVAKDLDLTETALRAWVIDVNYSSRWTSTRTAGRRQGCLLVQAARSVRAFFFSFTSLSLLLPVALRFLASSVR